MPLSTEMHNVSNTSNRWNIQQEIHPNPGWNQVGSILANVDYS